LQRGTSTETCSRTWRRAAAWSGRATASDAANASARWKAGCICTQPGRATRTRSSWDPTATASRASSVTRWTAGPGGRAVDIGAGAGAGALALAARPGAGAVFATDINPSALRCLSINARHAGLDVTARLGPGLTAVQGDFDLIIANPPYIADRAGRTYRDGGGMYGARLALDWMMESVPRLAPGGRILLYTGAPIVDGRDVVRSALEELATEADLELGYEEIDPDVFGGVLRDPAYAEVERIAAVGAVLSR
jgi:SAM-dependent methyltransferase